MIMKTRFDSNATVGTLVLTTILFVGLAVPKAEAMGTAPATNVFIVTLRADARRGGHLPPQGGKGKNNFYRLHLASSKCHMIVT